MVIKEFIDRREAVEKLLEEADHWISKKSIYESSLRIEKARTLLVDLKKGADNDVQHKAVERLAADIDHRERKVEQILSKREAGKKQDGNLALKCNWNDRKYSAPCGLEAYSYNLMEGRTWCSSHLSKCRDFLGETTLKKAPCYESIALKEMYFGAGWDREHLQPSHINHVRTGRMAILTTRLPYAEEQDRIVIACLLIKQTVDDPGEETKIYGDKEKSIIVDYDFVNVKFWDYYKNPAAEDKLFWGTGLFRYVTDGTVLGILHGIGEQYKNTRRDVGKVIDLIKYYEGMKKNISQEH